MRTTMAWTCLLVLGGCSAHGNFTTGGSDATSGSDASLDESMVSADVALGVDVAVPDTGAMTGDGGPSVDVVTARDAVTPVDGPASLCAQLCERTAAAPGCPTPLAACLDGCASTASRVPASCLPLFNEFLVCAQSSPVECSGTTATFTDCTSLQAQVGQCILRDAGVSPDAGVPADPTSPCPGSWSGLSRECGWTRAGTFPCTPGDDVVVGCNATAAASPTECAMALGACTGDPVMRVCSGASICTEATQLASEDDTCGACPVTTVTCPPSGTITVMVGSYSSSSAGTCTPAVR